MNTQNKYLFTSPRLGFRNWTDADIDPMARINADERVMAFFPSVQTKLQTQAFVNRMQEQYIKSGFCYFAVEVLDTGLFIGCIGLSEQTYLPEGPFIDIGWRLACNAHGNGYATEGAVRCLEFAFRTLQLSEVFAVCPAINKASENIMIKAGMNFIRNFDHPLLINDERLQRCVLYSMVNDIWQTII